MADWVKTNLWEATMNLQRIHLSLDPRAVPHLRLLAEEAGMTLVDLLRETLNQHLIADLRRRRTQDGDGAVASDAFAYARQRERAEELAALRAWARLSPEARRHAAESGLIQPPPPALKAVDFADGEVTDDQELPAGSVREADDGRGPEGPG